MVSNFVELPITEVLREKVKIGPFGSQLKKETLVPYGEYKVYGQENVYSRDFGIGERFLKKEHYEKLSSCEIKSGDFLMSTMGTIGKCAIAPEGIQPGIMDSHLIRFRLNEKRLLSEYLLHLFSDQHSYLTQQTSRLAVGGIMDGLSVGIANSLSVMIPEELTEQREIATALSEVDKLIDNLEKVIDKKIAIKQGTMQQLITGKRRLSGYSGSWQTINISQKSKLKARIGWQGLTTAEYQSSGYSYLVTGTDFENGRIDWSHCHFVSFDRFAQDPNIQVANGDVLLTKDGTIGKVALVDGLDKPATLNSGVFVIRSLNEAYSAKFLYYVLSSSVFTDFLDKLAAGSTISHLYQKDLVEFEFDAPPTIEEQDDIANLIYDMECEIRELKVQLKKYKNLKTGMMNELLTGRTRLI